MTIRRRDFLTLTGAAALCGRTAAARARRRQCRRLRSRTLRQCAHPAHDRHACAAAAGAISASPASISGSARCRDKPPHLVGRAFLDRFGIPPDSADAYAFTCLDFEKSALRFGKLGGFAHLKTLIERLRSDAGSGRSLLLDGGDLWQGTGLANAMQGADMVEAANLLGIEAMTGHWEFTYGENGAARQSRALQGRIPGAERVPHRGSGVQRRQGLRSRLGPRVQAGHHQGDRRPPRRRDRAGLSLCADRPSQALYPGLDLRHPRRRIAETGQCAAQQRQGRCRAAAVAQRHGCRSQACQPRHRHRRHPRRPYP